VEEVRRGEYWGRQMLERVQWWRGVEEVLKSGAQVLLEVGPGESLTSVVREGVRGREVTVLSTLRGKRGGGEAGEREIVARLGEDVGAGRGRDVGRNVCGRRAAPRGVTDL
jgi:acyl transferase domain-containing protein